MAAEKGLKQEKANGKKDVSSRSIHLPWPVLVVNFILMAFIMIAGFLYTQRQISRIKTEKINELRAIATLKMNQINAWLQEIVDDGRFLRSVLNFGSMFHENRGIKQQSENQKTFASWIRAIQNFEGFASIRFLDGQGQLLWPPGPRQVPPNPEDIRIVRAILATGEVSLSDLYYSRSLGRITLDLRVPINLNPEKAHQHHGALILSIDPGHFLFPLIQSWPTASPSAETLLVRREGDEVVFLNELRHRRQTALRLRYPFAKKETPAVRAARGEVGFVAGPDYRGVPVLADIHHVPGTSWSLIAKIDQDEVRNLVARQQWVMYALILTVFLLVTFSIAYSWRRQQVSFLRRQLSVDAALQESENRYRQMVEHQGEGIGITDREEKFIFANPAAEEIFGVTPGSLTGRNLKEFLPTDELSRVEEQSRSRGRGEKGNYELRIRRPDGTERTLLVTAMPSPDTQEEASGAFAIFRDISDRKRDEEKIRKMLAEKELLLKEVHHRVKNNMMVIGSLLQIQVQRINDPKTIMVLQESQNRIRAMMTIYEKLYRKMDMTHIRLGEYFSELAKSLFAAYNTRPGRIDLETAIDDIELDIDRTIPCGLIINELVSNALKYAFPDDRHGRIRIEFCEITAGDGDTARRAPSKLALQPLYTLTVSNNGVPLPAGFDISTSTSFGLQLVGMLAGQLGGRLRASSETGTEFRVAFPKMQSK